MCSSRLTQCFVDAAERLQRAGFSGVELHGAHGYLLTQFMSPFSNDRDDKYGGSREGRIAFVRETIAAIRARCGAGRRGGGAGRRWGRGLGRMGRRGGRGAA